MSKQKRKKNQNEKKFSPGSIRPGRVFYYNDKEAVTRSSLLFSGVGADRCHGSAGVLDMEVAAKQPRH